MYVINIWNIKKFFLYNTRSSGIYCTARSLRVNVGWISKLFSPVLFSSWPKHVGVNCVCKPISFYLCAFDVRGSVRYSTVLTEKPNKMQQVINILLSLILNEAQHVSGDTPPIIRSLKLHKQPPVLHNTVEVCRTCSCWTLSGSVCYLTTSNNWTSDNLSQYYAKPEAACAVLGSWWWAVCRPKHVELHLK